MEEEKSIFKKTFGSNHVRQDIVVAPLNTYFSGMLQEIAGMDISTLNPNDQVAVTVGNFHDLFQALQNEKIKSRNLQNQINQVMNGSQNVADQHVDQAEDVDNQYQDAGSMFDDPPENLNQAAQAQAGPNVPIQQNQNNLTPADVDTIYTRPDGSFYRIITGGPLDTPNVSPIQTATSPTVGGVTNTLRPGNLIATPRQVAEAVREEQKRQNLDKIVSTFNDTSPMDFVIWFSNLQTTMEIANVEDKSRQFFRLLEGDALLRMKYATQDFAASIPGHIDYFDIPWEDMSRLALSELGDLHPEKLVNVSKASSFRQNKLDLNTYCAQKRQLFQICGITDPMVINASILAGINSDIADQFKQTSESKTFYERLQLAYNLARGRNQPSSKVEFTPKETIDSETVQQNFDPTISTSTTFPSTIVPNFLRQTPSSVFNIPAELWAELTNEQRERVKVLQKEAREKHISRQQTSTASNITSVTSTSTNRSRFEKFMASTVDPSDRKSKSNAMAISDPNSHSRFPKFSVQSSEDYQIDFDACEN